MRNILENNICVLFICVYFIQKISYRMLITSTGVFCFPSN